MSRLEEPDVQLVERYALAGYEVLVMNDSGTSYSEVWEDDDYLFTVPSESAAIVQEAVRIFDLGFQRGKVHGVALIQTELRNLLGVKLT